MERGSSYNKHAGRRDKNVHHEGPRNSARQQYQDPQGSGTANSFGGHQPVQSSVAAPAPSPMFPCITHSMPSQIQSGAQNVFSSQQPQMDCYQIHTPPPQHELYYGPYNTVAMQPVLQGSVIVPHATIKMNLPTSANKTIDANKSKCCQCGFNNTFWELELSKLETELQEHKKIISEKNKCIEEKEQKIQILESELSKLSASPISATVNDVQNDSAIPANNKTAANSKTQLSADAPEFKFHSTAPVPVVSANGDINKNTKNVDNYPNKKIEDSAENEGCALPRDDDFNNNNCEQQDDDLKISSSTSVAQSDSSSSVATLESPSYSKATKLVSGDDVKRSEPDRSHLSGASVRKKRSGKDNRNDSVDYPEAKRGEPSYQRSQFSGPARFWDKRHVQSNQIPLERKLPLERKGRNSRENVRSSVIKEIEGDLFEASDDYSLAHCVGQDFRMGSGIAVEFRKRFKRVTELISQKVHVGKVAFLEDNGRYIFYLVTKPVSTGKPTFDSLKSSVDDLKQKCLEHGVKKLAMPKIGCGLDRLNWHEVKQYLERTFQGSDIDILVYCINQTGEREGNQLPPKFGPIPKTARYPLLKILEEYGAGSTGFVFFGTADGHMDKSGEKLEKKFHFADEFKRAEKSEGTVVKISRHGELIFSLIVKNREQDEFSFSNLEKCLNRLSLMLKEARYNYIAFEAFEVPTDDTIVYKMLTMCCNYIQKHVLEVWVCWPPEITDIHGYQRKDGGNVQYSSKPNY